MLEQGEWDPTEVISIGQKSWTDDFRSIYPASFQLKYGDLSAA